MIYRKFEAYLNEWYKKEKKLALLIDGARQIGKTTLIREFAKKYYGENFVEINFIDTPSAKDIFNGDFSAQSIIDKISLYTMKPLVPHKTLIFFDEVQECLAVRTAIKFLVDDGRFDYIESGSLLGIAFQEVKSYAVGYEEIKTMYPIDFEEFAIANGTPKEILDKLESSYNNGVPVDTYIHEKMLKLYAYYLIIGGMPAVVQEYLDTKDMIKVVNSQQAIIQLYKKDISKYNSRQQGKLQSIFECIPSELNDKNKRFILTDIAKSARMERYESGFNWLNDAGVTLPCYNIAEVKQPIAINTNRNLFKLFLNDTGLLCAMCSSDIQYQIVNGNLEINNGSILENAIAKDLKSNGFNLYYIDSKKFGEVDFIVEQNSKLLPVEVKSGKDYKTHRALNSLLKIDEYKLDEGIVFCNGNVEIAGKIKYLPLYMIMYLKKDTRLSEIKLDFSF